MNELQALIVGSLIGALMAQKWLDIELEVKADERTGNYEPSFIVVGRQSGERVRVSVEPA